MGGGVGVVSIIFSWFPFLMSVSPSASMVGVGVSVGVSVGAGVGVCDVVVVSYLSLRTSFGGGGPLFGCSAISMTHQQKYFYVQTHAPSVLTYGFVLCILYVRIYPHSPTSV